MKAKQPYPIVAVLWDDATALDGWAADEEPKPCLVLSVGFLVKKTRTHLILAQDLAPDGHKCGRGQIPMGMVKQIKVLKKKDAGAPR